jgi:hypothetical protein
VRSTVEQPEAQDSGEDEPREGEPRRSRWLSQRENAPQGGSHARLVASRSRASNKKRITACLLHERCCHEPALSEGPEAPLPSDSPRHDDGLVRDAVVSAGPRSVEGLVDPETCCRVHPLESLRTIAETQHEVRGTDAEHARFAIRELPVRATGVHLPQRMFVDDEELVEKVAVRRPPDQTMDCEGKLASWLHGPLSRDPAR